MSQVPPPKEINDTETQCKLQLGTPCSHSGTWMLATCRPAEILLGSRRRSSSGIARALWWSGTSAGGQVAGALDDTDMCDKHVVIVKLLRLTST